MLLSPPPAPSNSPLADSRNLLFGQEFDRCLALARIDREGYRTWAVGAVPKFIYVDEYPELDGHQDISAYVQRKSQGQAQDSDKNFEKLCKVAVRLPLKSGVLNPC